MDLTTPLLRAAAGRPRVLLLPMPGATGVRLAAERELRLRDFPAALTPAEADVLLVAGPVPPALSAAVDRLWRDTPAPRARVHADAPSDVTSALDAARTRLAMLPDTPPDAPSNAHPAPDQDSDRDADADAAHDTDDGHGGHDADAGDGAGHDDRDGGHGGRGEGHDDQGEGQEGHGGGHGDHGGHGGHGGMEMPAGLPMAERGPDRDGLALDRLHVPLGPLLTDWPAGLTVRLTLQGDVVQEATVDDPVTPAPGAAPPAPFWTRPWQRAAAGEPVSAGEAARRRAAAHLDSLGRLLAVAGWPAQAVTARRLRDDLLDGAAGEELSRRLRRFTRRVGRSRTLHWLTHGIGPLSTADAGAAGVGGPAARADGDVPARYRQWLAETERDVARLGDPSPLDPGREEGPRGGPDASAALVRLLPGLLEGAELAAARLIVASLDPDPDELAVRVREVAGG
ncbi:hypothetical protein ABZY20_08035 [Streptomyces sp. NPDC006624]|uniref:hypothetical protein n=1 Tax=unclassified Streptomyces TaxID=2593676 RepID=UPI0033B33F4D